MTLTSNAYAIDSLSQLFHMVPAQPYLRRYSTGPLMMRCPLLKSCTTNHFLQSCECTYNMYNLYGISIELLLIFWGHELGSQEWTETADGFCMFLSTCFNQQNVSQFRSNSIIPRNISPCGRNMWSKFSLPRAEVLSTGWQKKYHWGSHPDFALHSLGPYDEVH